VLVGVDASRVTRAQRTGTENYSLHLLRHLLALDHDNAYRLYVSSPLPNGLLPRGPHTTARLIRLPRLWTHLGLSREMLIGPPDLLFVPSHVLPLVTPPKSVVVVYDVGHRVFPRAHALAERLYLEWSVRRHVRIATRLLTISEATRRDLVRLYGADPSRIDIAYPAVEARFRPATPDDIARVRDRHGLSEPYVLHLGTIKPRKNLPRLIRAFGRARLPGNTQLALGGMTTYGGQAVEEAIVAAGLERRVRRLTYVPDEDLPALFSGAACVAVVSLYEGFGMPALEALACGAPLLVSNRGALPEIAADAAVIADAVDVESIAMGLTRLVGDESLRAELRERGPRRAASFDWSSAAQVTRRALEQAFQSDARRHVPSRPRSVAS
jgi:glycosyltransferase involved in cell wall biosynthesis